MNKRKKRPQKNRSWSFPSFRDNVNSGEIQLVLALLEEGDIRVAHSYAQDIEAKNPKDAMALALLVRTSIDSEDFPVLERVAQSLFEIHPYPESLAVFLQVDYMSNGARTAARRSLQKFLKHSPQSASTEAITAIIQATKEDSV